MEKLELEIGGLPKESLIIELSSQNIKLNDYAKKYIYDERFIVTEAIQTINIAIVDLRELGFEKPQSLSNIYSRAVKKGFSLCPFDAGIYLRLALKNQTVSQNNVLTGQHKAPEGAITVASNTLSLRDEFPKGLYLRNVGEELWLRGYTCDEDHKWALDSNFAFVKE